MDSILWYDVVYPYLPPFVTHSFPPFSRTTVDKFILNIGRDFFINLRSSLSVVNFRLFLLEFMSLLELKILEINSFPHFSHTCFDMLSWNFLYDFLFMECISSLSIVKFGVIPFWSLKYSQYTVYRAFL